MVNTQQIKAIIQNTSAGSNKKADIDSTVGLNLSKENKEILDKLSNGNVRSLDEVVNAILVQNNNTKTN
jgi:hypothetical protein